MQAFRQRLTSIRRFNLIGVAVVCMTVLAAGMTVWDLRQEAIKTDTEEMENLGAAFAEQTSRSLQAVDLVLNQVKDRVSAAGIETAGQFEQQLTGRKWRQFLAERLKNLPQAASLTLVDADGRRINAFHHPRGSAADFSSRRFIEHFRLRDEPTSFLEASIANRDGSGGFVLAARRISGPAGEAARTPTAVTDPARLEMIAEVMTEGENLAEFVDVFLASTGERIAQIHRLIDGGHLRGAGREAHTLFGTAGNFGACHLSALAAELRAVCDAEDAVRSRDVARGLMECWNATSGAVRGWLNDKDAARAA